ncbi:hypothetical protein D3C71_2134020 [compost metagenome]
MAFDDFIQRHFQMLCLQGTAEAHGAWQVIGGTVRCQLLHEPQSLLREGERGRSRVGTGNDALGLLAGICHQQRQYLIIE